MSHIRKFNESTKKVDLSNPDWELDRALDRIINKNCEEIPYEGTNVNKQGIKNDILAYLKDNHYSLLKHNKS